MGPSLLRAVQNTGAETSATYAAKVQRDLADLERLRPPLRSYAFEGWALLGDAPCAPSWPRLHRLGLRALLYTRAYVAGDVLRTQPAEDFDRVTREGDVATDARGRPFVFDQNGSRGVLIDPTSAGRRGAGGASASGGCSTSGADGFMDDFGEQVQLAMHFHDGVDGPDDAQPLPGALHRLTRAPRPRGRARTPGAGGLVLHAPGWTGRPGSAANERATFAGDGTTDWAPGTGLHRRRRTCSTAPSAAPGASRPTSAATSTCSPARRPPSSSPAGRSGRR